MHGSTTHLLDSLNAALQALLLLHQRTLLLLVVLGLLQRVLQLVQFGIQLRALALQARVLCRGLLRLFALGAQFALVVLHAQCGGLSLAVGCNLLTLGLADLLLQVVALHASITACRHTCLCLLQLSLQLLHAITGALALLFLGVLALFGLAQFARLGCNSLFELSQCQYNVIIYTPLMQHLPHAH